MTEDQIKVQHMGHDLVAAQAEIRLLKDQLRQLVSDAADALALGELGIAERRLDRVMRLL